MKTANDGLIPDNYNPDISINRKETYYCGIQKYVIESQFNNDDDRYFNADNINEDVVLFTESRQFTVDNSPSTILRRQFTVVKFTVVKFTVVKFTIVKFTVVKFAVGKLSVNSPL